VYWDTVVVISILLYLLMFSIEYYNMAHATAVALFAMRVVFVFVFVADTAMRIAVRGIRFAPDQYVFNLPKHYVEIILNSGTHRITTFLSFHAF
jgi:hypothetical protein